jgi:hypothetical protein
MELRRDGPDIALGAALTGLRAGIAVGRLALLPIRVAARAPVVGPSLRSTVEGLAIDGRIARVRGRRELEAAIGELLAAPEVERAIDATLAGPLTDAVARSLVEHRVVERVAAEVVANGDLDRTLIAALDHEATHRLVETALGSPGLERLVLGVLESRLALELTDRLLRSDEMQQVIEHIATSPEIREALTVQSATLAEEMAAGVRQRSSSLDDAAERRVRGWLRRPRPAEP